MIFFSPSHRAVILCYKVISIRFVLASAQYFWTLQKQRQTNTDNIFHNAVWSLVIDIFSNLFILFLRLCISARHSQCGYFAIWWIPFELYIKIRKLCEMNRVLLSVIFEFLHDSRSFSLRYFQSAISRSSSRRGSERPISF